MEGGARGGAGSGHWSIPPLRRERNPQYGVRVNLCCASGFAYIEQGKITTFHPNTVADIAAGASVPYVLCLPAYRAVCGHLTPPLVGRLGAGHSHRHVAIRP